jgi:hypothetical protein
MRWAISSKLGLILFLCPFTFYGCEAIKGLCALANKDVLPSLARTIALEGWEEHIN